MAAFANVRARWHALSVYVLATRIESECAAPVPRLQESELDRLLQRQDHQLRELFESARELPRSSSLRRAAERAYDTGRSRLEADPASEAYALASHEHELALRELRAAIVRSRS